MGQGQSNWVEQTFNLLDGEMKRFRTFRPIGIFPNDPGLECTRPREGDCGDQRNAATAVELGNGELAADVALDEWTLGAIEEFEIHVLHRDLARIFDKEVVGCVSGSDESGGDDSPVLPGFLLLEKLELLGGESGTGALQLGLLVLNLDLLPSCPT